MTGRSVARRRRVIAAADAPFQQCRRRRARTAPAEPTALCGHSKSSPWPHRPAPRIHHSVHIADITMFYAPTSGGVRTYLEYKQRYLATQSGIRHSVLVPGKRLERQGAFHTLPAPPLGWTGYRLPLRGARWTQELCRLQPDLIEVGDPYRLAWAALAAGQRLGIPVIGFYHSDLPRLVDSRFGSGARRLAERYVRNLYTRFQEVLAPSRVMARQLHAIGVERVTVQPLGVDTQAFNPGPCRSGAAPAAGHRRRYPAAGVRRSRRAREEHPAAAGNCACPGAGLSPAADRTRHAPGTGTQCDGHRPLHANDGTGPAPGRLRCAHPCRQS